ncbi:transketolase C-terminal domain-containing protein [Anaerotignum sp.]|uniref:transketolase C-terminal domain-containing protein n=1 Tax=Anaerotignum sp. TaxID=2039241 RepID=UPI003735F05C
MVKKLLKGNYAIAEGAISAGCRFFYGYPITPQTEIMEWMSVKMNEVGGTFLQAESEVGAANMVIGTAAAGQRVMTASSGPGIDLMQEAFGNIHAHQLPCVVADITRGGPGDGALHVAQGDYNQIIKGGRADTHNIVLAPWNVQEMYDLTVKAFELAEHYRNLVFILSDSLLGQVYENVEIDTEMQPTAVNREWAITGAKGERKISIAHFPEVSVYNAYHAGLQDKYKRIIENEQRSSCHCVDDETEVVVVAYGMVARNAYSAITRLREQGVPVGLFRPITLWPFPVDEFQRVTKGRKILVVEMSSGQMADDIKLLTGRFDLTLKPGVAMGEIPRPGEIEQWIREVLRNE